MSISFAKTQRGMSSRSVSTAAIHMENAVEVIPRRLYWAEMPSLPGTLPAETANTHYFCTDGTLTYEPFYKDFGPLNLGLVWKYCTDLQAKMADPALKGKRIIHLCSQQADKRANAACLICAYQVIVLGKSAEASYEPFVGIEPPFQPFRDALCTPASFDLHVSDVLEGLAYSIERGWFDWTRFDARSYDYFSKVQNGDMNVVVPGKFLAFCGPSATSIDADGYPAFTPEDYVPMFMKAGISLVVRLNKKQYEKRRFTDCGLKHLDLYFRDGSCPPPTIVSRFLQAAESEPGGIAVHCKAGLGRTGTLIGLYAMKHNFFPARAFIGWIRMCRPGSVLGPQQQYLCDMQTDMFQAGLAARGPLPSLVLQQEESADTVPSRMADMAMRDREDVGQGERLCSAKRCSQGSSPRNSESTVTTPSTRASTTPSNAGMQKQNNMGRRGSSASASTTDQQDSSEESFENFEGLST